MLVEEQSIFRCGLRAILASIDGFDLIGEAVCGSELIELLRQRMPDIVIIGMPDICDIDLIARIHSQYPVLPILVLSMLGKRQIALGVIKAGAHGYITRNAEIAEMILALRKVARGGKYVAQEIAECMLFDHDMDSDDGPYGALTDRERTVLDQLVIGRNSNEIAHTLFISNKTVSTHKMNLLEKMHLKNTAELVRYAVQHGLLA
jgi:DNA-binding NarL/FixJ family response regulator